MKTVEPNQTTERTGQRGALPSDEYDIHCVAAGGPEHKMNYFRASCDTRLGAWGKENACKHGDCQHYRGAPPKFKKRKDPAAKKYKKKAGAAEPRECLDCGKVEKIAGRGLCRICYGNRRYYGTLGEFGKVRSKGATVAV